MPFAPFVFVVLWSTGFITARLIAPYAEPLTFLAVRYVLAVAVLAVIVTLAKAPWPRGRAALNAAIAGILMHGLYLGGAFWAIANGLPAGIGGLFAGLQPLMTAMVAPAVLGEHVSARQWLGVAVGFAGVMLVLAPKLTPAVGAIPPVAILVGLAAVVCMVAGTIWQKRTGQAGDLRAMTAVQYIGALAVTVPAVLLLEEGRFDITPESLIGLGWAVLGLSVGAMLLLLGLIRRGAVSSVSALLYLVPAVTALMAWALFDETLVPVQLAGMALASLGVALAVRRTRVS